ncbi:MAG: hypothetical protein M1834_003522 [Cirrosporium novae-zelandiae]|nr:MAG: hypothetical protein M1834_003522 [Cirrosporium novae-zelandiae]
MASDEDQVGIAILGAGIFASEAHLPAILANSHLILKAVYSRSKKSTEALVALAKGAEGSIDIYSDDGGDGKKLEDLLTRKDIKGVVIALPIPNQPAYIKKALQSGKHVLSEKPIAPSLSETRDLMTWYDSARWRFAGARSSTWSVAENFRFIPQFVRGAEEVRKLGRVLGFRVQVTQVVDLEGGSNKYAETEWRRKADFEGAWVLDGGVHFVAGLRALLLGDADEEQARGRGGDQIASVCAVTGRLRRDLGDVDTVDALLKTRNGVSGTFTVSYGMDALDDGWMVICEKGVVRIKRNKVLLGEEVVFDAGNGNEALEAPGVKEELEAWAEGLRKGDVSMDPRLSTEEAIADLEVLESCLKSGKNGGTHVQMRLQDTSKAKDSMPRGESPWGAERR